MPKDMTPKDRDLLTRALPFLAPKAAALVTDFLMTEVFPSYPGIGDADVQQVERAHRESYVLWRQISLWLYHKADHYLYKSSMFMRGLRELERNLSRHERPD
jgi:hypothetical protein